MKIFKIECDIESFLDEDDNGSLGCVREVFMVLAISKAESLKVFDAHIDEKFEESSLFHDVKVVSEAIDVKTSMRFQSLLMSKMKDFDKFMNTDIKNIFDETDKEFLKNIIGITCE